METLRFKQLPHFRCGASVPWFLLLTSQFSRCAQIDLVFASSQPVKCSAREDFRSLDATPSFPLSFFSPALKCRAIFFSSRCDEGHHQIYRIASSQIFGGGSFCRK